MGEFVDAALAFPAVLFTFLLVVVVGYWILVLLGALDIEALDFGGDGDALGGLGFAGVPVALTASLLIAIAWFVSLAGTVLVGGVLLLAILALIVALAVAWFATRLLIRPLRRLFPTGPEASRSDFVGSVCVIRTGRVSQDFGQAEVTAKDGSSAIIQVRQTGADSFKSGTTALIYDYDADGEFFWVTPVPQPEPHG
ncbi:hypothetical protein GCM10022251_39900 [Phytohabitans flavus]|uniref:DUF1449 domain-containing protein n=1 Tax=Phytohabitans flavus TaxID=1076124 RepID=A0A6F8Y168_9ACTN|nr:hypothetical protein [Phytohabitans flavus]BCB79779.1 hypothetical protein Pflav_061890 [Phytohabitans flavus]